MINLSVIIPVYNKHEVTLQCQLLNLRNAANPVHWIFIDNNSDDLTVAALKQFKSEAEDLGHTVHIEREAENTGVARAWNKGLSLVNTEFTMILNNDCVLCPAWDKLLTGEIKHGPFDLICPWVIEQHMVPDTPVSIEWFIGAGWWQKLAQRNKIRRRMGFFGGVIFFAKTELYQKLGGFDPKFWLSMEDIDFEYRAMRAGYKIGTIGFIPAFHLFSATRREVPHNEVKNQLHFQKKHGWHFQLEEQRWYNKLIRSWRKRMLRRYWKMSTIAEIFPSINN